LRNDDGFEIVGPNRNGAHRGPRRNRRNRRSVGGNAACHSLDVLNAVTRAALIALPLTVAAARLHGTVGQSPIGVTQDLNRCLLIVRTAASKRSGQSRIGTKTVPTATPGTPMHYYSAAPLPDAA